MAKRSAKQIEQDKKRILDKLVKNSQMSAYQIANNLGFSRQKAWRFIKNLEEDETIWGYTAIINDNKLGLKRFNILLKLAPIGVTDKMLNIIINRELGEIATKNKVNLESIYFLNGSYDGQISVTAENVIKVKKFISNLIKKLGVACFKEINILEVLTPIQMRGFNNPNLNQLKEYFSLD